MKARNQKDRNITDISTKKNGSKSNHKGIENTGYRK